MSETALWIVVGVILGALLLALGYAIGFRHGHAWAKNPPPDEYRKRPSAC